MAERTATAPPRMLLRRDFAPTAPDRAWVGDLTYIKTFTGWAFLATVIDCHSRRLIGCAIAQHMRTDLITDALRMAIVGRNPPPGQLPFRPRRPSALRRRTSRRAPARRAPVLGSALDNAAAEAFNSTLKIEYVHRHRFRTRAEARLKKGGRPLAAPSIARSQTTIDFERNIASRKNIRFVSKCSYVKESSDERDDADAPRVPGHSGETSPEINSPDRRVKGSSSNLLEKRSS